MSPEQKAAIIAAAILEEEEEVGQHRIGAVYADPAVRRRLANGQGPANHAKLLEAKYNILIAEKKAKKERARRFRNNVGRIRGPDRNVTARHTTERHCLESGATSGGGGGDGGGDGENVSNLLSDICADLFPHLTSNGLERHASDVPSGDNPLDTLPTRDKTAYNATSGYGSHHGGTHRRKGGHHEEHPIAPPPKPPHPEQTAARGAYGSNRYGRTPIPICRYDTGADIGLQKECTHLATHGSHFHKDRTVLRQEERKANMGRTTLGSTTATRRTSPKSRLLTLKRTGQIAKQVVFRDEVEEAAVDFLACASVKKKYVPPGAQSGSKSVFAQKLWQAMKKTPSIVQFWTHTIAEKFARNLFSDRSYFNLAGQQN